jgi:hypothetical protein
MNNARPAQRVQGTPGGAHWNRGHAVWPRSLSSRSRSRTRKEEIMAKRHSGSRKVREPEPWLEASSQRLTMWSSAKSLLPLYRNLHQKMPDAEKRGEHSSALHTVFRMIEEAVKNFNSAASRLPKTSVWQARFPNSLGSKRAGIEFAGPLSSDQLLPISAKFAFFTSETM